jgi:hypothetical protein
MILKKNFKQKISAISITEETYWDALNNIKGDAPNGIDFEKIVDLSLAYLINFSFGNLSDSEFNLETFKAILDKANNDFQIGYTPNILKAYNSNATYKNTSLFTFAYCIVQFDYYFKSIDLKGTDFYKYTNHYFETGAKLNIDDYKGDKEYLIKEYSKMDSDGMHRAKHHIKKAFVGSLFLLLNELQLPTDNFKNRVSNCREYNAMVKTPREFRKYFPFKLLEFDIKSAFPRFIDEIIDSNISSNVYDRIMQTYSINRAEAKILFNKWLNSGKYKTEKQFFEFFEPIYKEKTEDLVKLLTNKEKPFWKVMFYWEHIAIETFVSVNKVEKYTRLHDAIFVVDNEYNAKIKNTDFTFVTFGAKKYFSKVGIDVATDKKTPNKYTPAIPFILRRNTLFELNLTKNIESKTFGFFRIFKEPFYYLNANFNISANGFIQDSEFVFYDSEHFYNNLQNMVNVMAYLNDYDMRQMKYLVKGILLHILENGIINFDLNEMVETLVYSIETPEYKYKNHLYCKAENISIPEYQKEYYKALKLFDSVCYAESVFSIVETSCKQKKKLCIDYRSLNLRNSKGFDFVLDLIKRFNSANGFEDVRTADSFKAIFDKKREVGHPIENCTNRVGKNATGTNEIRDFDKLGIRPQTLSKFKKWQETKQNIREVQNVYYLLKEFIENASLEYEVINVNGRNEVKAKEQTETSAFIPYANQWSDIEKAFPTEEEFKIQMMDSILNKEEREIKEEFKEFEQSWNRFNRVITMPITKHKEKEKDVITTSLFKTAI